MRKFLAVLMATLLATMFMAGAAGAQDDIVIGEMTADPATVPEAGEYEISASVTGLMPDSTVLMSVCTAPGDELVPGVSTEEEITASAFSILPEILSACDLANALTIQVDGDGNFSDSMTVPVGTNTFFVAGAPDGSQAAVAWIPIVDPAAAAAAQEAAELAVTGAESWMLAALGAILVMLGVTAVHGSRRFDTV